MNKKGIIVAVISVLVLVGAILLNVLYKKPDNQSVAFDQSQAVNATSVPATVSSSESAQTQSLVVEDLKVGTGSAVKSGDTVIINYIGTLADGTKFDSSYDRGQPFETKIGVGDVIKGWDQGVVGMKVGGKRKLVIPPDLAYGNQKVGSIPPNSTLTFEVELVGIK